MNSPKEQLVYWIRERWQIKELKDQGAPKPWTADHVLRSIYMCNVRREDDKVTKWIRDFYSPHVGHEAFEWNMILARFLNWPRSLEFIGFQTHYNPEDLMDKLFALGHGGNKVWGNAYVITTHGIPMGKAQYLVENVLGGAYRALPYIKTGCLEGSLARAYDCLEGLEGLGPFLAAQVVADLKNTVSHPLVGAPDWWTFVSPGPGSIRGASWFHYGEPGKVTYSTFKFHFEPIRAYVDMNWPSHIPRICNQDLQNCLCEFDKYMRVKNGTGRSKRGYDGN